MGLLGAACACLNAYAQVYSWSSAFVARGVSGPAVDDEGAPHLGYASGPSAVVQVVRLAANGLPTALAGADGDTGYVDGAATDARFTGIFTLTVDPSHTIYALDTNSVRAVLPNGTVTTIAGVPNQIGNANGPGSIARFRDPRGITHDASGNVFVADRGDNTIRKIGPNRGVSIYAGQSSLGGSTDGPSSTALFRTPFAVAANYNGEVYVADTGNHIIRKISTDGFVSTVGGRAGVAASTTAPRDGPRSTALFNAPSGVAADDYGNVFVCDNDSTIRKIFPNGDVVTIGGRAGFADYVPGVGSGALLGLFPSYLALDRSTGTLYFKTAYTVNRTSFGIIAKGVPLLDIAAQPQSTSISAGAQLRLSVTTRGVPPFAFQWYRNGAAVSGATSATYTVAAAASVDAGSYSVKVSNSAGSLDSLSATVTLSGTVPSISLQPRDQSVNVGASVTFVASADGSTPLSYQWLKNGTALAGATSSTLTLSAAQFSDAGSYTCTVTNALGAATTTAATLQVLAVAPSFTNSLANQTITAGGSVTFTASVTGTGPLSYQWLKNGVAIAGATSATFTIASAQLADAGSYTCTVTNSLSATASSTATLQVTAIAPSFTNSIASQTITAGTSVTFTASATGTGPLSYQWLKNGVAIAGATSATFTVNAAQSADAGAYTCVVTNSAGSVTSAVAALTVDPASALSNFSIRTTMADGQTLIIGAYASGTAKNILVRAAGPALNAFGLTGLGDPRLELYASGSLLATNDDWPASLGTTFIAAGAFAYAPGSKDAAVYRALDGSFTVQAKGNGSGAILVEAYDVSGGTASRLVNMSVRNQVGTAANILIAGFFINGTGTKQLLIRAIGPTLTSFGVTGALSDPKLAVLDGAGKTVAENDNWSSSLLTTFTSVGAFPLNPNSKDSALLVTLSAGAGYSVQVSGADGGTGEALVEIYEVVP